MPWGNQFLLSMPQNIALQALTKQKMKVSLVAIFIDFLRITAETCEDCDYDYNGEDVGGKKPIVVKTEEELDRRFPQERLNLKVNLKKFADIYSIMVYSSNDLLRIFAKNYMKKCC